MMKGKKKKKRHKREPDKLHGNTTEDVDLWSRSLIDVERIHMKSLFFTFVIIIIITLITNSSRAVRAAGYSVVSISFMRRPLVEKPEGFRREHA